MDDKTQFNSPAALLEFVCSQALVFDGKEANAKKLRDFFAELDIHEFVGLDTSERYSNITSLPFEIKSLYPDHHSKRDEQFSNLDKIIAVFEHVAARGNVKAFQDRCSSLKFNPEMLNNIDTVLHYESKLVDKDIAVIVEKLFDIKIDINETNLKQEAKDEINAAIDDLISIFNRIRGKGDLKSKWDDILIASRDVVDIIVESELPKEEKSKYKKAMSQIYESYVKVSTGLVLTASAGDALFQIGETIHKQLPGV